MVFIAFCYKITLKRSKTKVEKTLKFRRSNKSCIAYLEALNFFANLPNYTRCCKKLGNYDSKSLNCLHN